MKPLPGFILASVLLLLLAACARNIRLTSPAQLSQLPSSRGINGGSYVAKTSWQYCGSDHSTHQFYYHYHNGNLLHRRAVSVPRNAAVLHFREVASGSESQWVVLQPGSTAFHFWQRRVASNDSSRGF